MALYRSYSRVSIPRSASVSSIYPSDYHSRGRRTSFSSSSTHGSSIFPLGRSYSQVFASTRSAPPSAFQTKTPYSTTPYYSESYPHVRHSHGYYADSSAVKLISNLPAHTRQHYSSDRGRTYLEQSSISPSRTGVSRFESPLYRSPYSSASMERPRPKYRDYVGQMGLDDVMNLYSKQYMTVNSLSRYFLNSSQSSPNLSRYSSGSPSSSWRSRYSHYDGQYGYGPSSSTSLAPYSSASTGGSGRYRPSYYSSSYRG